MIKNLTFVILSVILFTGCANWGKQITSMEQADRVKQEHLECWEDDLKADISVHQGFHKEVTFDIKCGDKTTFVAACAKSGFANYGDKLEVGKGIYYMAGIDVPFYNVRGNDWYIFAIYEKGKFREALMAHELTHLYLTQLPELGFSRGDPNHESRWFREKICIREFEK